MMPWRLNWRKNLFKVPASFRRPSQKCIKTGYQCPGLQKMYLLAITYTGITWMANGTHILWVTCFSFHWILKIIMIFHSTVQLLLHVVISLNVHDNHLLHCLLKGWFHQLLCKFCFFVISAFRLCPALPFSFLGSKVYL